MNSNLKYRPINRLFSYAKRRTNKEFNITKDYLLKIWKQQEGKCIYSDVQLTPPKHRYKKEEPFDARYIASIDRIDSNKGYVIGNIQFISSCMNYMKYNLSHDKTLELINIIKNS